ncbi:MAG: VIT family protein [Methanoregulaceae archaeon PtaB.Bin009]|jgi:VIT1/CCC1 family predicted Fe2+/Mn2+ transporter|nr:MAG: VIT family protein [Methanoregulaceae archaeon PtaB.Bin009]HNQ29331.1 VIT1/CCC1 transporter family protein [Methanolinea sp.]
MPVEKTGKEIPAQLKAIIYRFQRDEVTEYQIYRMLAKAVRDPHNASVLLRMADQELGHSRIWEHYTGKVAGPAVARVWFYYIIARLLGYTFAAKLMENRESSAIQDYGTLVGKIPEVEGIIAEEEQHEMEILGMLEEDRLRYVGSIVLGLNDALVEFTGSLAGFTFALQDTTVIAAVGCIMGVAAALSMASSEYLSQKADQTGREPAKAALYTGGAYIFTVFLLVVPFLLMGNPFSALVVSLITAVAIIVCFTFYTSVAGGLPFWRRFLEMVAISLGIAGVSFLIGLLIRGLFNVDV